MNPFFNERKSKRKYYYKKISVYKYQKSPLFINANDFSTLFPKESGLFLNEPWRIFLALSSQDASSQATSPMAFYFTFEINFRPLEIPVELPNELQLPPSQNLNELEEIDEEEE